MNDLNKYIISRRPLYHTAEAIRRGHITIGFIGGSITEPAGSKRWADKIADWFVAEYPGVIVDVENAAKGATGSLSSILYTDDSILPYNCDIVFIESAVNDGPEAWGPCREGVLRKLLKNNSCDIVITYTYAQSMYDSFLNNELPDTIKDWEKIAAYYKISSVFMSRYTFDLVMQGFLLWEEWLPDGLHPEHAGSRLYAEPVCFLLKEQINSSSSSSVPLPIPLYSDNWENTCRMPLSNIKRNGAWRMIHERRIPTVSHILFTASMKSTLIFSFEGRGLIIRIMMNGFHAAYRLRIDGGDWIEMTDPVPDWAVNANDWVREDLPIKDLPAGIHTAEIVPVFLNGGRGSSFELCGIGVIR